MPVTARLSKRFYDRLGDDVANELVNWFNSVDFTYRSELKELNTQNFAVFDAKLAQRFAESDARIDVRFSEQDAKWEKRFAMFDAKWEKRSAESDAKWEKRFADVAAQVEVRFSRMEVFLADRENRLMRWTITNTLALAALALAMFTRS